MEKKENFEYINEISRAVITSINLITKTNLTNNKTNQIMLNGSLVFLENYLNESINNENDVRDAIEFNIFESESIENQDDKFTFRDKVEFIFNILKMKESKLYGIILDNIDSIEKDISIRGYK